MLMIATLTGCGTTSTRTVATSSSTTAAYCLANKAITYSRKDTDLTIAQVRAHNAAYNAVCKAYWEANPL
jgi:uncharacterized protein YceK